MGALLLRRCPQQEVSTRSGTQGKDFPKCPWSHSKGLPLRSNKALPTISTHDPISPRPLKGVCDLGGDRPLPQRGEADARQLDREKLLPDQLGIDEPADYLKATTFSPPLYGSIAQYRSASAGSSNTL